MPVIPFTLQNAAATRPWSSGFGKPFAGQHAVPSYGSGKQLAGFGHHQRAEPSMDEVAVESHVGGSQGEAGADSDEVERAGDGPMCEAAAALAGSAAVEGVARDES